MSEARRAYIEARNAYDGSHASEMVLQSRAMQWVEAEIRARGAEQPRSEFLRRFWPS